MIVAELLGSLSFLAFVVGLLCSLVAAFKEAVAARTAAWLVASFTLYLSGAVTLLTASLAGR